VTVGVFLFGVAFNAAQIRFDWSFAIRQGVWPVIVGITSFLLVPIAFTVGLASLILNAIKATGQDDRRRLKILILGSFVGLAPVLMIMTHEVFSDDTLPRWLEIMAIFTVLFPASFIYVVVKHRVFGISIILRRGLQYLLLSRGFLAVQAAISFALM